MLHDLDSSLRSLLDDLAAPLELKNADVAFRTPERTYAPGQATVNLFAYELRENRGLRDRAPLRDIVGGVVTEQRAPIRVDCAYMVTAWSDQVGEARVVEEHRLLSLTLLWLDRFPEIPPAHRVGALATAIHPPPTMAAQAEGPATGADFWTALGIAPRASFRLLVTIELSLDDAIDLGPPVTTSEIRLHELPDEPPGTQPREAGFQIGGVVTLRATGAPVAGATVVVVGWPTHAVTDADGRFVLAGLPGGSQTLETSHPIYTTELTTVDVPAAGPNDYDHALGV